MGVKLKVENVGIRYITGDFKDIGIKEYVVRKLSNNYHVKEFMAVDGVSFELEEGDLLGIIGSNGAGKSTLLKAIAGIMVPTSGTISTEGEIAALLELGSGFDGDLTVKENAYLRGAMLGYTKEFMDATYDQIIDFAELREFEDRPFKQLSSGMRSRLAFSIASLVKPDILILDEVLSVGDGAFQAKSAKKMREIIGQGATTILVSHSLSQIRELCNKVLWLDHGKQVAFGDCQEICDQYQKYLNGEIELPEIAEPKEWKNTPQGGKASVKHPIGIRAVLSSLIAALFFGAMLGYIVQKMARSSPETTVTITAKPDAGSVTFRGASVDGTWCSPNDIILSNDGWVEDSEQATYTATGQGAIAIRLPGGQNRTLTFNVGPDEGIAMVSCGNQNLNFELRQDTDWSLGLSYEIPAFAAEPSIWWSAIAWLLLFALFVLLCRVKGPKNVANPSGKRELWGDLLRGFCSFIIILLHATCSIFDSYGGNIGGWIPHVLMNSLTAFAVPCFYMLSGAYLLRKEHSVGETLKRRVPRAYGSLLVWGILYLLMRGNVNPAAYGKLLFQNQEAHLWFMYSILGIYVLLPVISKMYTSMGNRTKIYTLIILLVIPTCFYDFRTLTGVYVNMPNFAVFWPDLGLFILGAFLWEHRDWFYKKKGWLCATFACGLALTALLTLFISRRDDSPNKSFISCIGSIGVVMMAVSVFGLGLSMESRLQTCGIFIRKAILTAGSVSFGVYLTHIAVMMLLTDNEFVSPFLHWNRGSLLEMLFTAVAVYLATAVICWSGKKIPYIRSLF